MKEMLNERLYLNTPHLRCVVFGMIQLSKAPLVFLASATTLFSLIMALDWSLSLTSITASENT